MSKSKQLPVSRIPRKRTNLFPYLKDLNLKPREIKFIVAYCQNNFNGTKAYKMAINPEATDVTASTGQAEIIRRPSVKEALRLYLEDILSTGKICLSKQLFDKWFLLAFYDPSMFIDIDGSPRTIVDSVTGVSRIIDWDDIPSEYRLCVEGIETKAYGKDSSTLITTIKLADRKFYMDKLDKWVGMTRELHEVQVTTKVTREQELELRDIFEGKGKADGK